MAKEKMVEQITNMETDFAQWYTDICRKAELVEYASVKGFTILRPYGYAIWENIQQIMDGEFKKTGHQNVAMPVLIPERLLKKEGELVNGFAPEVAWVTKGGSEELEEPLAFRPTSETMFCDHWSRVLHSYRELPMLYNQWCSVIRWEKTTRPFLRSREFWWQEGHTIHETAEEAEAETAQQLKCYADFFENVLAIPVVPGRKTEKEKFAGAEATYTCECMMKDHKALQGATSHYFGDKFSRAYNVTFTGRDNKVQYPFQTSWGSTTRMIGAVIMAHGDNNGLVLPPKIAPIQVIVLPIAQHKPGVLEKAQELNTERLSAIGRDRERLTSEISELGSKLESEQQNAGSLGDSRREGEARLAELNDALQAAIDRYTVRAEEVNNALLSLNNERNSIFELSSKAASKRTEAAGLDSLRESLEKRKLQIASERESEALQGKSEADLLQAESRAAELRAALESIRAEANKIKETYSSSLETEKQLAKDIEALKIDISRKEARKKTIEEMESNYEGYNFAVKYIMKSGLPGIYGTAAELMSVPKGYETAIETSMGAAMQNIVCADDECAKKAIISLKQAKAGRLTFIPLKSIKHQRAAADVSGFEGFLGYGDECVSFDKKYTAAFEYLLGRVVIVDTMDNAVAMSKKAGAGLRFVTLEGEIINTVGAITGGKYKNKTANLLERKSEITKLQEEIEALSGQRDAKAQAMNEAADAISTAQEKMQALNDRYRQTELDLITAENEKKAVEGAISDFGSRQERWDRELKSIEEQKASSDSMKKSLIDEAEEAGRAAELAEAESYRYIRSQKTGGAKRKRGYNGSKSCSDCL